MKPKTGMDLLIAEWIGDLSKLDEEVKKLGEVLPVQAEAGAKLIEESSNKAAATIGEKTDLIMKQMTAHQINNLNKIQEFFHTQSQPLANEINKIVDDGKKEIEAEKIKAIKEITAAINRVNGGNLIKPALIFAVVFALVFAFAASYFTTYLTMIDIKEHIMVNSKTASSTTNKH